MLHIESQFSPKENYNVDVGVHGVLQTVAVEETIFSKCSTTISQESKMFTEREHTQVKYTSVVDVETV